MKLLVLNVGSSTIKYKIFDSVSWEVLEQQTVEGVDQLSPLIQDLAKRHSDIQAIGHRVAHGGDLFALPTLIQPETIHGIRDLSELAPLHNPLNLKGIEETKNVFPALPQVAVFDTGFHHSLPTCCTQYALPQSYREELKIRRYGFHGTSHSFVSRLAAQHLNKPMQNCNFISLHLGNGASACAIQNGKSVDTSMGFTPLEGLVMGTRSGDIDPSIIFYVAQKTGRSLKDIENELNKKSGLLGLCGESDLRKIEALISQGNASAKLALEIFCFRIRKYIGAYLTTTSTLDAVILTGGIGENSGLVREFIFGPMKPFPSLQHLGFELDSNHLNCLTNKNNGTQNIHTVSKPNSKIPILVIRTNEELEIAEQTLKHIESFKN